MVITIALGRGYEKPTQIATSYYQARAALRHSFYLGYGSIIHINYVAKSTDLAYDYPREKEQLMIYEAVNGHLESALKLLDQIVTTPDPLQTLAENYYPMYITDILVNINRTAVESGISIKGFFKSYIRLNEINAISSAKVAHDYLKDALTQICKFQLLQLQKDQQRLLHELKSYVHTYYANKISLRRASQYLRTTPQYLERIIYQSEGQNFYDFCMNVRLTVAQDLLKTTTDSTAEIAAKIGFSNPEYFSAIFKQQFHMLPSTYRNDGSNVIRPHKLV
jgi:two-component system response regulator YesN